MRANVDVIVWSYISVYVVAFIVGANNRVFGELFYYKLSLFLFFHILALRGITNNLKKIKPKYKTESQKIEEPKMSKIYTLFALY